MNGFSAQRCKTSKGCKLSIKQRRQHVVRLNKDMRSVGKGGEMTKEALGYSEQMCFTCGP